MDNIILNAEAWGSWELYVGTLVFSIFAYLIGSLNGGQLYSKGLKHDLGKEGSGNYGGTNAIRTYGKRIGAFVMLIDLSKSIAASLLIAILSEYTNVAIFNSASVGLSLMFILIGHIWPIYFGFKGGKGVAVAVGVIMVLNWTTGLMALAVFAITSIIFKRVSVGSILGAVSVIIISISLVFIPPLLSSSITFGFTYEIGTLVGNIIIALIVIYKHMPNVKKILSGEDKGDKLMINIHNKIFRKKTNDNIK